MQYCTSCMMCALLAEAASTLKQCQDNQRESVSLLSNSLSLSSQTMAVCPEVEQIIAEWYYHAQHWWFKIIEHFAVGGNNLQ